MVTASLKLRTGAHEKEDLQTGLKSQKPPSNLAALAISALLTPTDAAVPHSSDE